MQSRQLISDTKFATAWAYIVSPAKIRFPQNLFWDLAKRSETRQEKFKLKIHVS